MKMSGSIAELAQALAKAQGQIDDASKNGINPHFRSKYADLAAVRSVIREPLAANGIAIVQMPRTLEGAVEVETMLVHESGEYIAETLSIPVGKWDAHGIGSGITYARRYGLLSILGVAAGEDDDGNAAVERAPAKLAPQTNIGPLLDKATKAAASGSKELAKFWAGLDEENRNVFSEQFRKELKKTATEADQKEAA